LKTVSFQEVREFCRASASLSFHAIHAGINQSR
jgi:hypothetical protein